MSIASREVKCVRLRSSCAGHSAPVQRVALSPSAMASFVLGVNM